MQVRKPLSDRWNASWTLMLFASGGEILMEPLTYSSPPWLQRENANQPTIGHTCDRDIVDTDAIIRNSQVIVLIETDAEVRRIGNTSDAIIGSQGNNEFPGISG